MALAAAPPPPPPAPRAAGPRKHFRVGNVKQKFFYTEWCEYPGEPKPYKCSRDDESDDPKSDFVLYLYRAKDGHWVAGSAPRELTAGQHDIEELATPIWRLEDPSADPATPGSHTWLAWKKNAKPAGWAEKGMAFETTAVPGPADSAETWIREAVLSHAAGPPPPDA